MRSRFIFDKLHNGGWKLNYFDILSLKLILGENWINKRERLGIYYHKIVH